MPRCDRTARDGFALTASLHQPATLTHTSLSSSAEAQDDLSARDRLLPRLMRLMRLSERADDSDTALGSDVMSAALEGYALLRISGRNPGLESLRNALSVRFAGRRRTPAPTKHPLPDRFTQASATPPGSRGHHRHAL